MSMTPHRFTVPARVEEIRPQQRHHAADGPDAAPATPRTADDGTPAGPPSSETPPLAAFAPTEH
jgi:hypothetical protein